MNGRKKVKKKKRKRKKNTDKRKISEIRQAGSSDQRSDNYGNKENCIFCMLKYLMLKFIPMMHLKHLALIKKVMFLGAGKDLQDV